MPSVVAYHRPRTLDEAVELLADPNRRALGGGTVVVPQSRVQRDQGVDVVDLQGLELDTITVTATEVRLGAMARLGDVATDSRVPSVIGALAHRELPSALRNQATVGGTVALADPESVLLAGLLAFGATVHLHAGEPMALADLLGEGVGNRLITSVTFDASTTAAWASTGRTPMDTPIVAAVVARRQGGPVVALTGVSALPVLANVDDPTAGLNPPADFRGSSEYRRELVTVLTRRALEGMNQ